MSPQAELTKEQSFAALKKFTAERANDVLGYYDKSPEEQRKFREELAVTVGLPKDSIEYLTTSERTVRGEKWISLAGRSKDLKTLFALNTVSSIEKPEPHLEFKIDKNGVEEPSQEKYRAGVVELLKKHQLTLPLIEAYIADESKYKLDGATRNKVQSFIRDVAKTFGVTEAIDFSIEPASSTRVFDFTEHERKTKLIEIRDRSTGEPLVNLVLTTYPKGGGLEASWNRTDENQAGERTFSRNEFKVDPKTSVLRDALAEPTIKYKSFLANYSYLNNGEDHSWMTHVPAETKGKSWPEIKKMMAEEFGKALKVPAADLDKVEVRAKTLDKILLPGGHEMGAVGALGGSKGDYQVTVYTPGKTVSFRVEPNSYRWDRIEDPAEKSRMRIQFSVKDLQVGEPSTPPAERVYEPRVKQPNQQDSAAKKAAEEAQMREWRKDVLPGIRKTLEEELKKADQALAKGNGREAMEHLSSALSNSHAWKNEFDSNYIQTINATVERQLGKLMPTLTKDLGSPKFMDEIASITTAFKYLNKDMEPLQKLSMQYIRQSLDGAKKIAEGAPYAADYSDKTPVSRRTNGSLFDIDDRTRAVQRSLEWVKQPEDVEKKILGEMREIESVAGRNGHIDWYKGSDTKEYSSMP